MRTFIIVTFMFLAACETERWSDVPGSKLRPLGRVGWVDAVEAAVQEWDKAMTSVGCPAPFEVADDGHAVELIPRERWPHGEGTMGITFDNYNSPVSDPASGEWIDVVDYFPDEEPIDWAVPILLHELGHAMGLQHVDEGSSVMWPSAFRPDVQYDDVIDAAAELGCDPTMPPRDNPARDYSIRFQCGPDEAISVVDFEVMSDLTLAGASGEVDCASDACLIRYGLSVDTDCHRYYEGRITVGDDHAYALGGTLVERCGDAQPVLMGCEVRVVKGYSF